MLGIIVELSISWLLLWFFANQSLTALGIIPTKNRLDQLLLGFIVAASCYIILYCFNYFFCENSWGLNKNFTIKQLLFSGWWTLKSVLFEELLFRGALLFILIKKNGVKGAVALSAILFGIYHWFTFNTLGNPLQMLLVFISTGIWGLMFAVSFVKTKSLYLPIGIHFGWDLVNIVIFSKGPLGQQLLIEGNEHKLIGIVPLMFYLFQILALPIIIYWYLKTKEI